MHASGIQVDSNTLNEFNKLQQDPQTYYYKFQIANDTFQLRRSGRDVSDEIEQFNSMERALREEPDQPAYLVYRKKMDELLQLIFYMPEGATVRDRMIYASSTGALKDGLGNAHFTSTTYSISKSEEMNLKDYEATLKKYDESEILTLDEKLKIESETSSALSLSSVKTRAIVGLPINPTDSTLKDIELVQSGQYSSVILKLDEKSENLMSDQTGKWTLEQIQAKLPTSEPRYVLHNFQHEHEGKSVAVFLFVYYCPDDIKPKLKMFYSTCKQVVMKLCENLGIEVKKSLEISLPVELSTSTTLEDLYPVQSVKKQFKKPGKPGRNPTARLIGADGHSAVFQSPSPQSASSFSSQSP
jgi:twinfilin-like protein